MNKKVKKLVLAAIENEMAEAQDTIEMIQERGDKFNALPVWKEVHKELISIYNSIETREVNS